MRIRELARLTGVRKETIHYYAREGLLPKPDKTSHNQAEYDSEHVERIRLIKELQDRFFLPLSAIKKIFREHRRLPNHHDLIRLKSEYFHPLDQFLPEEIRGPEDFLEATGMSAERLADFEGWEIIAPKVVDGVKVYSHDDIIIGKVIGDMRRLGFSAEKGYRGDVLKELRDQIEEIVNKGMDEFVVRYIELKLPLDELASVQDQLSELTSVYAYHLFHRQYKKRLAFHLEELKDGACDEG